VYDKSGKFLQSLGARIPGCTRPYDSTCKRRRLPFYTDTNRHQVFKTSITGKVLLTIDYPAETEFIKTRKPLFPPNHRAA
jgi:hypothetical protein